MLVKCPGCPTVRELTRDRGTLCRTCAIKKRRESINVDNLPHRIYHDPKGKPMSQYLRTCTCGDKKWVNYVPTKDTQCRHCSAKANGYAMSKNNIKDKENHTIYEHICSDCGKIRWLKSNPETRKTTLCGDCSRSATGKANAKIKPKLFVRKCIIEGCDDIQMVASKLNATGKMCKSCRSKLPKKKKTTYPKNRKSKKGPVSQQAIERARKINAEHREDLAEAAKVISVPKQKLTDKEMTELFLETNTPSVVDDRIGVPHFIVGGLGSGTSVLGA